MQRAVREAERRAQALALLPQGQVQRGALERPAAVRAEELLLRRFEGEQVQAADQPREAVQRPGSGQRQIKRVRLVILGGVRDVLPAALVPAAAQHDGRGHAQKAAGDFQLGALRRVAVDLKRQSGQPPVGSAGLFAQ